MGIFGVVHFALSDRGDRRSPCIKGGHILFYTGVVTNIGNRIWCHTPWLLLLAYKISISPNVNTIIVRNTSNLQLSSFYSLYWVSQKDNLWHLDPLHVHCTSTLDVHCTGERSTETFQNSQSHTGLKSHEGMTAMSIFVFHHPFKCEKHSMNVLLDEWSL